MKPFRLWIYHLLTWWLPESRAFAFKCGLLRWSGARVGKNVRIYSSARVVGTGSLIIGDDVHIGGGALISSVAPHEIRLGSHIDVGPNAMLLTGTHMINPSDDAADSSEYLCSHMAGAGCGGTINVGDGVWIGARAVILPNVSLPRKTLVSAGAVVSHTLGKNEKCLWAGVPAKIKKEYASTLQK